MNGEVHGTDEQIAATARRLLDQSVADLDPATAHRLQRARLTALEATPVGRWRMVLTGGLAVAVAALTLTLTLLSRQPVPESHVTSLVEDIDLVLSADNIELAEDLEFYHWLADADTTG
jgi:hypothetical protein